MKWLFSRTNEFISHSWASLLFLFLFVVHICALVLEFPVPIPRRTVMLLRTHDTLDDESRRCLHKINHITDLTAGANVYIYSVATHAQLNTLCGLAFVEITLDWLLQENAPRRLGKWFIFTIKSEVDFGIGHGYLWKICCLWRTCFLIMHERLCLLIVHECLFLLCMKDSVTG